MSLKHHTRDTDTNAAGGPPPLLQNAQQAATPRATTHHDEIASGARQDQVRIHLQRIESFFEDREFDGACHELDGFAKRLLDSMTAFLDLNENSLEAFQEIDRQTQSYLALHKQIHRYKDFELRRAATRHAVLKPFLNLPR